MDQKIRTERSPAPAPESHPPSYPSPPTTEPDNIDEVHEEPRFAAQAAAFSVLSQLDKKEGEAVGVLYCPSCNQYFGNVKNLQRHYVFSVKHGEEPRELRDLYYKLWRSSWKTDTTRAATDAEHFANGAAAGTHAADPIVVDAEDDRL